jgi:hypothetical protein
VATTRLVAVVGALALLVLVVVTPGQALVRRVSFTAVVYQGESVRLEVNVSPRTRCTITVVSPRGASHTLGLRARSGGRIVWRWRTNDRTPPGRWPVRVDCGGSGRLSLHLRVLGS